MQVKILRNQTGIIIRRRAGTRIIRYRTGPMVHDVVEVNADAEAMGGLDHLDQLRLGAVHGGDGALLVGAAEIKRIKGVVAHGISAAISLGRVGQPQTVVTGLGQFGHLLRDLRPGFLKQLEQPIGIATGRPVRPSSWRLHKIPE